MKNERWILGPDEQSALFNRLLAFLKPLGFKVVPSWPKEPKDLGRYPMSGPNGDLVVDAEDPEGLVVTASPDLIRELKSRYPGA